MALHETRPTARYSSRFRRWYVTLWANLAALALGYMILLFVAPDWMARSVTVDAQSEQQDAADEAITAGGAAHDEALRESVAELEGGTTQPETSAPATGEQDTTAPERVAFAEQSVDTAMPQPPEETVRPQPSPAAVPTGSAAPPPVAFEFPTAAGPKIVIVDGAATSSISTGSLPAPPPPIAFGPATVTPASAPVALHLGSGASLEALQLNWSLLSEQHHSVLRNLKPRYDTVGTGDTLRYELVAGPIATAGEAKRVCALLRAKNVPCGVGPLVGEAL